MAEGYVSPDDGATWREIGWYAWRRGYVNRRFEAARAALIGHECDCEDCRSDAVRAVFEAVGLEAPELGGSEPGGAS